MSRKNDWTWSKNPTGNIKIGNKWTFLAIECYLQKNCSECIYWRYCKNNKINRLPIMRHVVRGLYAKLGKPPAELIDKVTNYDYNE